MSKKLLSLFLAALLLCVPSISFATNVMTRCYSKTIGVLDSYTKLLIHGDSIGDATGKTVTANGNAAVTTAQYKFAELGRSLVFDGVGDYLSLADSDDWNFGTGDFTIDFWVRFSSVPSGTFQAVFGQFISAADGTFWLGRNGANTSWYGEIQKTSVGTSIVWSGSSAVVADTWYHIAVIRYGSSFTVYQDGVSIGSTSSSDTVPDMAVPFTIGRIDQVGAYYYFNGWLSSFRISKGTARWTSNFTPPTAPYDGVRTVVNVTGLDGDTDEEYRLMTRLINGSSENTALLIRYNNDSGTNYGDELLTGASATAGASRNTDRTYLALVNGTVSGLGAMGMSEFLFYAKSGHIRTSLNQNTYNTVGTTITGIVLVGGVWNNTLDNITSLVIFANQTNGLGVGTNIELYKKSAKQ